MFLTQDKEMEDLTVKKTKVVMLTTKVKTMEMILETIMKRKKSQMMRVIPMKMTMEKTLTTTSQMMKVTPMKMTMEKALTTTSQMMKVILMKVTMGKIPMKMKKMMKM